MKKKGHPNKEKFKHPPTHRKLSPSLPSNADRYTLDDHPLGEKEVPSDEDRSIEDDTFTQEDDAFLVDNAIPLDSFSLDPSHSMLKSTLPFTIDLKHLNALLTPSTSTSTSTSTTLVDAFTPLFSSTPLHPDLNARSSPPLDPNPTPIPLNPSCKASVSDHDPPEKKEKKSPLFVHPEESSSPPFPTPPPWPPAPSAPSSSSLPLPVSSINDPVLSVDAWLDVFLENEPKT